MYILYVLAIVSGLIFTVMQMSGAFKSEEVKAAQRAPAELLRYRHFTQAVEAYVAANPTYTGTVTWPTLKAAASTAEGMRNMNIPANFKAVVAAGQFVVCGQLSPQATALLVKELPPELRGQQRAGVGPSQLTYQVLGPSTTDFAAEANKCAN